MSAAQGSERVPFKCPDGAPVTFEFHFTRELIALATTAPPFNTVTDIYLRIHRYDSETFNSCVQSYEKVLRGTKNWHTLQADATLHLSIFIETETDTRHADDNVTGIFALLKSGTDLYLLNILCALPLHQTSTLLSNLGSLGICLLYTSPSPRD